MSTADNNNNNKNRKRARYATSKTNKERLELLVLLRTEYGNNAEALARNTGISPMTIRTWRRKGEEYYQRCIDEGRSTKKRRSKQRVGMFEDMEKVLYNEFVIKAGRWK